MADKKISQLSAATTPLAGTEVLPIVQGGSTVKVSVADLTAGRAVSAASATVSGNLIVDTNTLYVDAANNRVGINRTPSAGFNLDVDTSGATYPRLVGSDQANVRLRFENGGGGGRIWELVGGLPGANNSAFSLYDVTGTATRLNVDTSGNLTVNAGNLVVGTAAKGIDFSASSHTAGMTSELLNDYEEGFWTPTISLSSGSVTYSSREGKYVKVGSSVTVNTWIILSGISSPTGSLSIDLPFAMGATATRPCAALLVNNLTGVTGQVFGYIDTSSPTMYLRIVNNGAASALDGTNLQSNSELYLSVTYCTN